MTKIYLIRHGQSEWNKLNKIQGQRDTLLTELGKNQALLLGDRLANENIDMIYTSDLTRAYDTAKAISNRINKPLFVSDSIREINFNLWEGLTNEEVQEKYKDEYSIWLREPHKLNIQGVETLNSLQERAMKYINKIIKENNNKSIAIVSHGAILKTIILGLLDIEISHYKNISLSNVSLSIIECRDFNNVLKLLNDTSHLKEL
ncbi:histidine phosphatase family protein [Tissierella sp.]|uniref:histidine phosphatase family protein n=1 Tax=Tissierella sp. TaxID=41274 RepID=UPI0028663FDF|nr:histidine phosphatase family protein [Tissierella sp.]MDR7856182.1 histidine phosphatase family protein [Tissierella sp.]